VIFSAAVYPRATRFARDPALFPLPVFCLFLQRELCEIKDLALIFFVVLWNRGGAGCAGGKAARHPP
jgi:hypothetical protein